MTRFILKLVPEREQWLGEIAAQIPQLEIVRDQTRNAMDTFMLALLTAGDDAAVHLEDDIELTGDFLAKIEPEIAQRPDRVIQFFSLRKNDAELGSREMPARSYLMNQCVYLPAGYAGELFAYQPGWMRTHNDPNGCDLVVAHWLVERRERYWLHVPSLVQHRIARSVIDRRRSSKRQSPSFR
jgi:hypothetical protein